MSDFHSPLCNLLVLWDQCLEDCGLNHSVPLHQYIWHLHDKDIALNGGQHCQNPI